jgi:hypothetical protein
MALDVGLDRRSFLRNAGLTALAGAVGGAAPTVADGAGRGLGTPGAKYDFDTVYSRVGTDCVKWDRQIRNYGKDDIAVGMGIADMDFRTAPAITRALLQRMQH